MWCAGRGGCLCPIFVADQLAAQRGEHVGVADGGLVAVPRCVAAAGIEVGVGVAVQGVPGDRCATRRHAKGDAGIEEGLIRAGWNAGPWADAAAWRSWGQPWRGIVRQRREQPRQRSGRAALPDARVRASKTER